MSDVYSKEKQKFAQRQTLAKRVPFKHTIPTQAHAMKQKQVLVARQKAQAKRFYPQQKKLWGKIKQRRVNQEQIAEDGYMKSAVKENPLLSAISTWTERKLINRKAIEGLNPDKHGKLYKADPAKVKKSRHKQSHSHYTRRKQHEPNKSQKKPKKLNNKQKALLPYEQRPGYIKKTKETFITGVIATCIYPPIGLAKMGYSVLRSGLTHRNKLTKAQALALAAAPVMLKANGEVYNKLHSELTNPVKQKAQAIIRQYQDDRVVKDLAHYGVKIADHKIVKQAKITGSSDKRLLKKDPINTDSTGVDNSKRQVQPSSQVKVTDKLSVPNKAEKKAPSIDARDQVALEDKEAKQAKDKKEREAAMLQKLAKIKAKNKQKQRALDKEAKTLSKESKSMQLTK
ncbi:hypothetical protein [Vibrio sp. WXL210]|uniref:hypothetical protein n=1 Tax=Vibrio sp. WXL210 TaxID=3450709 RepID=UPI003EC90A87